MKEETALTVASSPGTIQAFSSQANFEAAQRMAKALASSTLVPKEYQGNVPNCLIAMELAGRVGVSVFAAMQNLDIIHGRPSWRATFLVATVNSCGRFSPLRFRFEGKEGTDSWGCRAYATDKDTGEECVGSLITMSLAKAEGWSQKSGSKWKTMPEQMLMYRAASFWARIYAPEISLGMMTEHEAQDIGPSRVVSETVEPSELEKQLLGTVESVEHVDPVEDESVTRVANDYSDAEDFER